jgi:hypothetical protein
MPCLHSCGLFSVPTTPAVSFVARCLALEAGVLLLCGLYGEASDKVSGAARERESSGRARLLAVCPPSIQSAGEFRVFGVETATC